MNQLIRHVIAVEIIRQGAAVVFATTLLVGSTTAFAESANWSDRFGLGLFFMVIGVGIVTVIHCHKLRNL
jgi:phosphatidylglycerophosphate synthase